MPKCRDCVHWEACREYVTRLAAARGVDLDATELEQIFDSDDCDHFHDSSRFVELPCKVGDTFYLLHNVYNNILSYSVSKILINSGEPIIEIVEAERRIHTLQMPARKLKGLFLTKEQAEQALKERESND